MNSPASPRQHGLDTLRAAAILLVYAYHYALFVSREQTFGWLSEIGWVGVDLFFVLSGYLIANQLLGGLRRGERLSLPRFYGRRLLRTLPNFYVVLAAFWLLSPALGGREPPPLWRFLSFTQNINLQPGTAFSHAWSLCIEEQFYLLLPAALLLGSRLRHHRRALAWGVIALLTLAACLWRDHLWRRYGLEAGDAVQGYYPHVYYASLTRLDEFLPGVAVALLKHGHPRTWAALMAMPRRLLALGLGACGVMLALLLNGYYIDGYGYGHAMTTAGYSAMAWAFAVLLTASLCPGGPLARWRLPGANALARWSYALYLTHKPIAFVLLQPLAWAGIGVKSGLAAAVVSAVCLLGGWLLYRSVERPFLDLRDRMLPGNFLGRAPATPQNPASLGA